MGDGAESVGQVEPSDAQFFAASAGVLNGRLENEIVFQTALVTGESLLLRRDAFAVIGPGKDAIGDDARIELTDRVPEAERAPVVQFTSVARFVDEDGRRFLPGGWNAAHFEAAAEYDGHDVATRVHTFQTRVPCTVRTGSGVFHPGQPGSDLRGRDGFGEEGLFFWGRWRVDFRNDSGGIGPGVVDPGEHVEEMLVDRLLPGLAVRRRSTGYVVHGLFSIGPVEFLDCRGIGWIVSGPSGSRPSRLPSRPFCVGRPGSRSAGRSVLTDGSGGGNQTHQTRETIEIIFLEFVQSLEPLRLLLRQFWLPR